jgi:hypothetical protein
MTTSQPALPVDTRQIVSPATLTAALTAAGGDRSRLQLNEDGSVTVLNGPRPGDPNRHR